MPILAYSLRYGSLLPLRFFLLRFRTVPFASLHYCLYVSWPYPTLNDKTVLYNSLLPVLFNSRRNNTLPTLHYCTATSLAIPVLFSPSHCSYVPRRTFTLLYCHYGSIHITPQRWVSFHFTTASSLRFSTAHCRPSSCFEIRALSIRTFTAYTLLARVYLA